MISKCKCGGKTMEIPSSPDITICSEFRWCPKCGRLVANYDEFLEPLYLRAEKQILRDSIFTVVENLVSKFLYHDRTEDLELPVGVIEDSIQKEIVSINEVVDLFRQELQDKCKYK